MKKLILFFAFFMQIHGQVAYAETKTKAKAADPYSRRLEGVIKKGRGDIDLFKVATGNKKMKTVSIEALRIQNKGKLVFGIDVNEALSGTENKRSQGVAVKSASIDVKLNGKSYHFDDFSTNTRSSLSESGTVNRKFYYTLIGNYAGDHITKKVNGVATRTEVSSADSTLTIPVDIDISKASSIIAHFELLNTNNKRGDPEAFYDFSGGDEIVSLLTKKDGDDLDKLKPGQDFAPLVIKSKDFCAICGYSYYPSATDYYLAAYEDQYPQVGDYDFNDLIVTYRISYGLDIFQRVKTIQAEGYLVAKGGSYDLDWYLNIPAKSGTIGSGKLNIFAPDQSKPMPGYPRTFKTSGNINIKVFSGLKSLYANKKGNLPQVNTIWNLPHVPGHKFSLMMTLNKSVPVTQLGAMPFDPYIFVKNTKYEVHLPNNKALLFSSLNLPRKQTVFTDKNKFPFAMILPSDYMWPNEYINIAKAYPKFSAFKNSGGKKNVDWYKSGIPSGNSIRK